MTVVFGDVKNIAGLPTDGEVWVSSPRWRPGGSSVVTMVRQSYEIKGGSFETGDLIPGEVQFEFSARGSGQTRRKPYSFVVPDQSGRLNFVDLLEDQFEYPAEVVGQAQLAAREARGFAKDARLAADRVGSAEQIKTWTESSSEDAAAADASAAAAAGSESVAVTKAGEADTSADAAKVSEDAAKASESAAAGSASAAASDRAAASVSATAAKSSEDAAKASESAAKQSETSASSSATAAADARDSAQAFAGSAQTQAQAAQSQADRSKTEADRAAVSAAQAADAAATGVPDATTSAKGKVRLAGDLAGTADAPTVPGLANKADLVGGQVPTSQLPAVALTKPSLAADRAALLAMDAQEGDVAVITAGADKGTYMLGNGAPSAFASWVKLVSPDAPVQSVNGQTGTVNLSASNVGAAPASHTHTVAQVTGLQSALNDKASTTAVNARPALFSGAGAPPAAITGAVVGDWWLDTTTMELSTITGV